ncbi:MAG: DUF2752 domain-containing protein [Lachnospiraceae bacterium]|nr:DUF2752 domain-containing protein [Lachnospiraceae bacterium]
MTDKFRKNILGFIITGAALLGYLLLRRLTGFYIPCPFRLITGLKCPGCGVTKMIEALLMLDFTQAYEANPFLFVTLPFLIFEIIYEFFLPHKNLAFKRINTVLLCAYCAALIIFGIARNTELIKARFM